MPELLNLETMDLIVLCGGRGSRLGSLTEHTPKPLLPVGDRPFLYHVVSRMQQQGLRRVILAAHYLAEQFEQFVSHYKHELPAVELVIEPMPLGTGGALRYAAEAVRTKTLVAMNGDTWVAQPIAPVVAEHARQRRDCTAVAVRTSHVEGGAMQKGRWRLPSAASSVGFETLPAVTEGWINAGLYVLERALVEAWPRGAYSLEEQFPTLLRGRKAGIFCSSARLLDIGTPACFERAQQLMELTMISSVGAS